MKKTLTTLPLLVFSLFVFSQGGTSFSTAANFTNTWINGCSSSGTSFSNIPPFSVSNPIDPCAPTPSCATGATGNDNWFRFVAQTTTATISINPNFDAAIQAFSGTTCPGLTEIGCTDANGTGGNETLLLTSLTPGVTYYFRIFGATDDVNTRKGNYNFCGSFGLSGSTLPVRITYFNGYKNNGTVVLNWTTASENDNLYFIVEHSTDGHTFQNIGQVQGNNTTSQTSRYTFTHQLPQAGVTNYYRLKQVDQNGSITYSTVLRISPDDKHTASVTVFPNPVINNLQVKITATATETAVIKIINAAGITVYQKNIRVQKGENIFIADEFKNIAAGMYITEIMMTDNVLHTSFLKISK